MASSSELTSFLALVRSIPPDANPYPVITEALYRQLFPATPNYFFTCLKVNIFLYAVISFLCVVCLAGKFYSGSLWLIRSRSTPTGTLWLPNSTVLYCFWICYFATMCEVFCALTMRVYGPGGGDPRTLQAITGAWWLPVELSILSESWGLTVAAILSSSTSQGRYRFLAKIPAWTVNIFFIGIQLTYILAAMPLFSLSAIDFKDAFNGYIAAKKGMLDAAADWEPGQPFQLRPEWLTHLDTMSSRMRDYIYHQQGGFYVFLVFLIITALIFLPLGFIHAQILRAQMASSRQNARNSTSDLVQTQQEAHSTHLRRTYASMIAEAFAVSIALVLYIGLAAAMATHFEQLFGSASGVAITQSLALFVYSTLGIPVHILIARRVLYPLYGPYLQSRSSSTQYNNRVPPVYGISVVTHIEQFIDQEIVEIPLAQSRYQKPSTKTRYALSHPPFASLEGYGDDDENKHEMPYALTLVDPALLEARSTEMDTRPTMTGETKRDSIDDRSEQ